MKVLSIGNFGTGWDGSICDELHIATALIALGHEVTMLQRDSVSELPSGEFDFTLIAQWDGYPQNLNDILEDRCGRLVYWAFDYQADGQEWHERLVKAADLYLSKRIADSKYKNWRWLPQDFAPTFLDRVAPVEKDIDVLFTGSNLPWAHERNAILKAVDQKFNLVIHSVNEWPGFKDVRPPVMDHGLPALYARAKVNLSIDHTIENGYWSDRNAQIMACGEFPLFRYVPLSEAVFRQHAIYFYSKEHCLEQIEQLLQRPREDMDLAAESAYNYAQEYLMVTNRAEDLINIVYDIL